MTSLYARQNYWCKYCDCAVPKLEGNYFRDKVGGLRHTVCRRRMREKPQTWLSRINGKVETVKRI